MNKIEDCWTIVSHVVNFLQARIQHTSHLSCRDLHTVDDGVLKNLELEMKRDDWEIFIGEV